MLKDLDHIFRQDYNLSELSEESVEKDPYKQFELSFNEIINTKVKQPNSMIISTVSSNGVPSNRVVLLKHFDTSGFVFFSNYNSPKSFEFYDHSQISALIYWNSINVQIRMKAHIKKTNRDFNQVYFAKRDMKKNALAICSNQSSVINSYEDMQKNYEHSLSQDNLKKCPDYWGGFSFTPYYFEFWEGHESRLNKRELYQLKNSEWVHSFLQA